jgi:hypothetical protein
MQEVETGLLLDTALAVELIDAVQHRKLDQLRLDRNVCAHPSLSPLGDIFAPSLDDARAHLAVALDALLVHAPSQGRRVVDRICAAESPGRRRMPSTRAKVWASTSDFGSPRECQSEHCPGNTKHLRML